MTTQLAIQGTRHTRMEKPLKNVRWKQEKRPPFYRKRYHYTVKSLGIEFWRSHIMTR